jgi:hypothetical protein
VTAQVVGGDLAPAGRYSYAVAIFFKVFDGTSITRRFYCGGSLIAPTVVSVPTVIADRADLPLCWMLEVASAGMSALTARPAPLYTPHPQVLTAGHCTVTNTPAGVVVGYTDLLSATEEWGIKVGGHQVAAPNLQFSRPTKIVQGFHRPNIPHYMQMVIRHPQFAINDGTGNKGHELVNDVALLVLDRPVTKATPVKLPEGRLERVMVDRLVQERMCWEGGRRTVAMHLIHRPVLGMDMILTPCFPLFCPCVQPTSHSSTSQTSWAWAGEPLWRAEAWSLSCGEFVGGGGAMRPCFSSFCVSNKWLAVTEQVAYNARSHPIMHASSPLLRSLARLPLPCCPTARAVPLSCFAHAALMHATMQLGPAPHSAPGLLRVRPKHTGQNRPQRTALLLRCVCVFGHNFVSVGGRGRGEYGCLLAA